MKATYSIKIEPEVLDDIQEGIDWYNNKQEGLGPRFFDEVEKYFNKLKNNPHYQGNIKHSPKSQKVGK